MHGLYHDYAEHIITVHMSIEMDMGACLYTGLMPSIEISQPSQSISRQTIQSNTPCCLCDHASYIYILTIMHYDEQSSAMYIISELHVGWYQWC